MQELTKTLVDLLGKLGPYISVPLLLAYGAILFIVIKLIGTLKDERITAAKDIAESRNQRIVQLEQENEALRQREVDPNKLLAEVGLIRMSTEEKVEAAKRRLNDTLEKLQTKESEVAEVRAAHDALLAELNRARERAEALSSELHSSRLNIERTQLLRIQEAIMHEILSPAMAIVGHAELLIRHGDQFPKDKYAMKLNDIVSEAMLLKELSTAWRFRSRQEVSLAPAKTQIHQDVLVPTAQLLEGVADRNGTPVTIDNPRPLPPALLDTDAFRQALLNILDNAIKYSCRGNPIHVTASMTDGGISIDVQNKGLTIPPNMDAHIFEVGFRPPIAVGTHPAGTGLSLYVAKRLLNAQGCDLVLAQREPITVFRINIPRRLIVS